MTAKVIKFGIPNTISKYEESVDFYDMIEEDGLLIPLSESLGLAGRLVQEHKYLMLNWVNADFFKPHSEWSDVTKYTINQQLLDFNKTLEKIKDSPARLIGGEDVLIKRARFVLRDITDQKQELARIMGIVSEVLFLEFVVYDPESRQWMLTEDYQVNKINESGK